MSRCYKYSKEYICFHKEILLALGINFMVYGDDWRLGKINFEGLIEIEYDIDIWNLKNEDKVEIVYQPRRRDNIVKKVAMVKDTSSNSK